MEPEIAHKNAPEAMDITEESMEAEEGHESMLRLHAVVEEVGEEHEVMMAMSMAEQCDARGVDVAA